jgi:hypothetical protein
MGKDGQMPPGERIQANLNNMLTLATNWLSSPWLRLASASLRR